MLGGALGENPPQQLADTMHRAWVEFASHGDPGWPRYDLDRRAVMRFDLTTMAVLDDPYAAGTRPVGRGALTQRNARTGWHACSSMSMDRIGGAEQATAGGTRDRRPTPAP